MFLLITSNNLCFGCIFILMLGSFLIGYYADFFKLKQGATKTQKDSPKEVAERIKPLGVIKTMERSGNQVEKK